MKTLGLIGGTSWYSTIDYYRYLNQMIGERVSPEVNPPLLLYSLNVALMRRSDWNEINEAYLQIARKLEQAGAKAILICANTPHKVIPFVSPQISIPFIHIVDAVAEEAKHLGLSKLGLLGTKFVMEEGFIKDRYQDKFGIPTATPSLRNRALVHRIIADELTQGVFKDSTRQQLIQEMDHLKSEGAEGIILGCTELPMILKPEHFDLPLLDTTYLHAKKAVDFILA